MLALPDYPGLQNFICLFPICYIIPSFALYTMTIYTVLFGPQHKNYAGPFFRLYSLGAAVAIWTNLALFIHGRILGAPLFLPFVKSLSPTGVIPAFCLFWLYYGMFAGEIVNCFLAVNRFTVVALKHNYARFWKKYLKFFIAFSLIVPLFFTLQFFFTNTQIVLFDENRPENGYTIQEIDRLKLMGRTANTIFVFGCTSVSSFVMNVYVSVYLIKQMYLPKSLRHKDRNRDESPTNKRFFAYNCFTFVMECFTAMLQAFMFVFKYGSCTNPYLFHVQIFVGDLTSLGPVWFMFFINKELRHDIFRLLRVKKYCSNDFLISHASNVSQVSFMNS